MLPQMDAHIFLSPFLHFIIPPFIVLVLVSTSYCKDHEQFTQCNRPYQCGIIPNLSHPFWGTNLPLYCGEQGYNLTCEEDKYPVLQIDEQKFQILQVKQSPRRMTITRVVTGQDNCPEGLSLDPDRFRYTNSVKNITLFYDCRTQHSGGHLRKVQCIREGRETNVFYADGDFLRRNQRLYEECKNTKVPVQIEALDELLRDPNMLLNETITKGFEVQYFAWNRYCSECEDSGGKCGSYESSPEFICLCPDQPHTSTCPKRAGRIPWRVKIMIGAASAGIGILITCVSAYGFRKKTASTCFMQMTKIDQDIEAFIRNNRILLLKRYSFLEVKKITSSFKHKLGQGGYGSVYKGTLKDGQVVAVKVLNTSKGNGQEFINEVASISRTSHVNVVTLLGFCLEGEKRALIYEFMPNGSLEKFINKEDHSEQTQHLGMESLLRISIGIAKGLEYLHRGCSTRIVHFDIKPHNILLDEEFFPKISDFGLAKLCTKKESVVSMLEARGTIGYIAPEVFSRSFGAVSHKSDVYSYGMMIIEMAGGSKRVDVGEGNSSDIYFPHWIYRRLELGSGFQLHSSMSRDESEIARKMIIVGLWCIQTNPSDRPAISEVGEMLQGSIESLQIPPKPFLSSPPRIPATAGSLSGSMTTSLSLSYN